MYFVVYIEKLKKDVILPHKWINGIRKQFEKFVNGTLKGPQLFLCYFTTNPDAFVDGRPDVNFVPNFDVMVENINQDGTFDGCFYGKIKKYRSKLQSIFVSIYILHFVCKK